MGLHPAETLPHTHVSRPCFHTEQGNVRAQAGHGKELEASRKMQMDVVGAFGRNPLSLGLGVLVLEEVGRGFMGRCAEEGLCLHLLASASSLGPW